MTLSLSLRPTNKASQRLLRQHHCIASHWGIEPNPNQSTRSSERNSHQHHRRTMSSGATRAATAASSRDIKQKLVKLLFRDKYNRTGPEGHARLDFSIYSYEDLRRAYFKRLQVIHPDKTTSIAGLDRSQLTAQQHRKNNDRVHSKEELKKEFQELQSTWDRYEALSKDMMKVIQGDGAAANFTKFGVGCSFSDNDEERALRNEITDQACRGWFSSGLVSSGLPAESPGIQKRNGNGPGSSQDSNRSKSLIDDSMFFEADSSDANHIPNTLCPRIEPDDSRRYKRTLIPGLN
mmetsp:Transcript_17834/g.36655  ORF Transcript_17834/g.36655 Transcript_17834/m.36655 type:complete len:292 (-) Transcript_17834:210-1085(-)